MSNGVSSQRSGFTLIELLVVIAIIAILAGILLPVLIGVRDKADSTKCCAGLGQVGVAIVNYAADHNDELPGPLSEAQYPEWEEGDEKTKGSLVRVLEKYLDTSDKEKNSASKGEKASVMLCPSWARVMKTRKAPVYIMNFEDRLEDHDNRPPWGDVANDTPPVRKTMLTAWRDTNPLTKSEDREMVNLTQRWAMKDADQEDFRGAPKQPDFKGELTPKPVHGDHRNALFYDFHVGKLDLDDKVK